jgi:hypothetical protein
VSFFVLVGLFLFLFEVIYLAQTDSKTSPRGVTPTSIRVITPTPAPAVNIVAPKPQLPSPPQTVNPAEMPVVAPTPIASPTPTSAPVRTPAIVPAQSLEFEPRVAPVVKPTPVAKQMNASVVIRTAKGKRPLSPFAIVTPGGANDYAIKLVDISDQKEVMLIYIKSRYETKVPLGAYRVLGTYGPTWFGENDLFGDNGSFFKFARTDGNDVLEFKKKGNSVSGHVISFVGQIDGNARSQSIPRDKF